MKIINLLNKMANGKEVPRQIKVKDTYWYWNDFDGYVDKWSLSTTPDAQHYLYKHYRLDFMLNDEIEIIEEPKKIEKLYTKKEIDDEHHYANILKVSENSDYEINEALSVVIDKINEIIDYINNKENNDV